MITTGQTALGREIVHQLADEVSVLWIVLCVLRCSVMCALRGVLCAVMFAQ